jgi:hydroxymethylbilane synthase
VRVRILSRSSALARLQVALVSRALLAAHPTLEVECLTRASAGDRDQTSPLWQMGDRGAFTADLSDALRRHEADLVVHSFKDLPVALPHGTELAGALPRADPRDVLLMRRSVIAEKPAALSLLSSSPRRAWLLQETLHTLLPWTVSAIDTQPVRGNIETRLRKLVEGQGHGLVMAKAALDRLLTFGVPFENEAVTVRGYLDQCEWMVMPMREFPWAPAQGAIAVEVASGRPDVAALVAPIICSTTTTAVTAERDVLAASGGGCHQALGAAIVEKPYGRVTSVRSKGHDGSAVQRWELESARPAFPRSSPDGLWPRTGEEVRTTRRALPASRPAAGAGLWVARADALPDGWAPTPATIVWVSGSQTWKRLAAAGVWVHGSADGLGDADLPAVNALAGRAVSWVRLTHVDGATGDAIATYAAETTLPDDLPERSHFFWMSGSLFTKAIERWPSLRDRWHASGPGRTHHVIAAALGPGGRTGVWLDRESWEKDTCL